MPMIPVNNAISGSCSVSISMGLNLQKTNSFFVFFYVFVHFFPILPRAKCIICWSSCLKKDSNCIDCCDYFVCGEENCWNNSSLERDNQQLLSVITATTPACAGAPWRWKELLLLSIESQLLQTKTVDASNNDGKISALCCSQVDRKLRKLHDGLILALLARVRGFEDIRVVQLGSPLGLWTTFLVWSERFQKSCFVC